MPITKVLWKNFTIVARINFTNILILYGIVLEEGFSIK